jgi:hypothetical protein
MTFNIAAFSTHLKDYGTVQTNKFMVRIPPPRIFGPTDIDRMYEFRAKNVKIPGISFDFQNNFRYGVGPQQKFPTNVHITDIDITFIDTADVRIWKHFVKWMNGIFDITGNSGGDQASYQTEYKSYYETSIEIWLYDNDGNVANIMMLKEAYPIALNDVSLSWSENNRLYEFGVRFAFREWYYDGYNASQFVSGAELGPGATSQVIAQRVESPRPQTGGGREYSSATEGSTGGAQYPQIERDVQNSRGGRNTAPGASGLQLQPGQSVTGNEGPVRSFNPFNLFR